MVNDHVGRTNDYIANLIRRKARSIVRHPGFTVSDIEDIKQELWLRLLERQKQFDPSRSSFPTFADRVIANKAKDILRDRRAQRRDPRREVFSVNDGVNDGDGEATSLHETIPATDLPVPGDGDLADDIDVLRSKLGPTDRAVLDGYLSGNSKRHIAEHMGVSRRQVDNAFARILDAASDLDLLEYLAG